MGENALVVIWLHYGFAGVRVLDGAGNRNRPHPGY